MASICIHPDHPSLPGHFPGHPVVPGVVILGEILHCYRQQVAIDVDIAGIPMVKFKLPLYPAEECEVSFEDKGAGKVHFRCRRGDDEILSGVLQLVLHEGSAEE